MNPFKKSPKRFFHNTVQDITPPQIEDLGEDRIGVRFPYSEPAVKFVRSLGDGRWDKAGKQWKVGISHLGEVMDYFKIAPDSIDKKLYRRFQVQRIRNSRVRIIMGHAMAKIEGANLPFAAIDEQTCFAVPGHQFMPRFIDGTWDGKRHLFNRKNQTLPAGLAGRVARILDDSGIEYETVPAPEYSGSPIATRAPNIELRDYQTECVAAALKEKRGVLELATGSGKTAIASVLIHKLARPALFLVLTRDLLHQTRDYLARELKIPVGCVGDGIVEIHPVTVATVQTCSRALGIKIEKPDDDEPLEDDKTDVKSNAEAISEMVRSAPVVFFDECHHLPADVSYSLAIETHGAAHRYGLSATPYRTQRDELLLEAALGPNIYRANASILIEKGFLVAPKITFLPVPMVKYSGSKQPDYQEVFVDCIVEHKFRNGLIALQARELAEKNKTVLILVSQVRHGNALTALLPEAPLIQGSDSSAKRRDVLARLESGDLKIVIATTLADEGLDIPSLRAVILASGGKSETRALQRVGRALRTSPRKKEAIIIDFMDNAPFLAQHSQKRMEIFKSERLFKVLIGRK